jgi:putative tricarboxylic transport membrane protein
VPFYIGLFALSELIIYTAKGGSIVLNDKRKSSKTDWHQVKQGIQDVLKRPFLVFQSAAIGTGIGLLPGVGGTVSAFISYAMAKRKSNFPEKFGKGSVEGLIAAEVANDAKEGGSLLPTVAFGIPGSADMAIVLGAFVLHGLEPGPLLVRDHLDVVLTLALGFTFSQIIGSFIVFISANYISRLVAINTRILAPYIIILCLGGSYVVRESYFDVILAAAAGLLGYFLKYYKFPVVPLAIGYILGDMAQKTFHQSLMMNFGSYDVFFSSKICYIIIVLILILLSTTIFKDILFKRRK